MRIQNERDRKIATAVLQEVKQKLEEAWRLARRLERAAADHTASGHRLHG